MPDIDRHALDEALAVHVHKNTGQAPHHPQTGWAPNYCGSLDTAMTALNALGLQWQKTGVKTVAVWRYGEHAEIQPADDATPAALATALVRAALAVLQREEATDDAAGG